MAYEPEDRYYGHGDILDDRFLVFERVEGENGYTYLCYDMKFGELRTLKTIKTKRSSNQQFHTEFLYEIDTWIHLPKHDNILRCEKAEIIQNVPFAFTYWVMPEELQLQLIVIIHDTLHSDEIRTQFPSWELEELFSPALHQQRLAVVLLCKEQLTDYYSQYNEMHPRSVTLGHRIQSARRDPWMAIKWILDICQGLVECRKQNPELVHGDIHSNNVLIDQGDLARLTDFGKAKLIRRWGATVSLQDSDPTDARIDVRGIGELVTKLLDSHSKFREEIEKLVARCNSIDEKESINSPEDLLQALQDLYQSSFGDRPPVGKSYGYSSSDLSNIGRTTSLVLNQPELAIKNFEQAIQLDSTNADAHYNLGIEYFAARHLELAISEFKQAYNWLTNADWRSGASASVLVALARCYVNLGQPQDALPYLNNALELNPNHVHGRVLRGQALASVGQRSWGLSELEKAIHLDPNLSVAHIFRAALWADNNQLKLAISELEQVLQYDNDSTIRMQAEDLLTKLQAINIQRGLPVIIIPAPGVSEDNWYCIAIGGNKLTKMSLALEDGTFPEASNNWYWQEEFVSFKGVDYAIEWAEEEPRCWRVINKYQIATKLPKLPKFVTICVREAREHPFKTADLGVLICYLTSFDLLESFPDDHPLPDDLRSATMIMEEDAISMLADAGSKTWASLAGRVLHLQIEDQYDSNKPWRLVRIEPIHKTMTPQSLGEHIDAMVKSDHLDEAETYLDQEIASTRMIESLCVAWKMNQEEVRSLIAALYAGLGATWFENASTLANGNAIVTHALEQAERCYEKAWAQWRVPIDRATDSAIAIPSLAPLIYSTLHNLGILKHSLGKLQEAIRCLETFIKLPPISAEIVRQQRITDAFVQEIKREVRR